MRTPDRHIGGGAIAVALAVLGAACDDGVPLVDVYDGSDELVLSVAYGVGFTGSEGLAENGSAFLYMTGDGRAWFSDTSAGWAAARELSLSPDQAAQVAASVGYGLWPRRYGDHSTTDVLDGWLTYSWPATGS